MIRLTAKEVNERVEKLQLLLRTHNIKCAIITQRTDLYYFTGGYEHTPLCIPSSNRPFHLTQNSEDGGQRISCLEYALTLGNLMDAAEIMRKHFDQEPNRIGLEMDVIPVKAFDFFEKAFPDKDIVDISSFIRQIRMVKSQYEISHIRKAAELADRLYYLVPEFIKTSESEIELALKAENFLRNEGFPVLVTSRYWNKEVISGNIFSGPSVWDPTTLSDPSIGLGIGPYLSQGAGTRKIGLHEPILVDYTTNVAGYLSKQTRIFSNGRLNEKFSDAHRVMLQVQEVLAHKGKPGVMAEELYDQALEIVENAGLPQGFMGHQKPLLFVGHGVGLEIDEWPIVGKNSEHVLEEGMVIALEEKFIFPGEGVVGTENTYLVTRNRMEKLKCFPDDITVL